MCLVSPGEDPLGLSLWYDLIHSVPVLLRFYMVTIIEQFFWVLSPEKSLILGTVFWFVFISTYLLGQCVTIRPGWPGSSSLHSWAMGTLHSPGITGQAPWVWVLFPNCSMVFVMECLLCWISLFYSALSASPCTDTKVTQGLKLFVQCPLSPWA
jgi:hypothetical protein